MEDEFDTIAEAFSRTAEKYTHYLSSLRDIIRHMPDEWVSSTRSYVSCHPYCGPREIISEIDKEMLAYGPGSREFEVLSSVKSFASLLETVKDTVAESLRA